jgi:anti-anti-sigma regulatory factor
MPSNNDRATVDRFEDGVIVRIRLHAIHHAFDEGDDVGPLGDLLRELADQAEVAWMIVDLSRVESANSMFFAPLCEVDKRMAARGAALRISGTRSLVDNFLKLSNLDQRFQIDRDVRAALDAVRRAGPRLDVVRTPVGKRVERDRGRD